MILTPTQNEIAADRHRFRVICCGRRWGKTTLAIEEIKGKALSKPSRIAYIAPTYQQARDIAWEMLRKELLPIIKQTNESRLELKVKTKDGGESLISLRGWESVETLRGQQFDLIVIDEIASMRNWWSNWSEVVRPTLTDTKGEAIFISTPKGFNHFYELYGLESKDLDYRSFHFSTYDNPFIPKDEIDKARLEMTENRFSQEYEADFRKTEGLVYKEFDRTKHIYKDQKLILNPIEVIAGVDFGFRNPCAVLKIVRDYDNKFWVTQEWYKTEKTDAAIAEYVSAMNVNKVYPDPENAGGIEELRKHGVNIREVIKGKNSIENGIKKVSELLKANSLMIHESCENLIWEFETYSYPDKRDMHNPDENPIKENDHAMDALRYAIMMQGEKAQTKAKQYYPQPAYQTQRYVNPQYHI